MLPEFLNVDLELESNTSLDAIAQAFGDRVHVLHNGAHGDIPHLLALEIYAGDDNDPESIIEAFCDLIEELAPKGLAIWKKCTLRRFDIGIESGTGLEKKFGALCLRLSPEILERMSALEADVVITVYPPRPAAKVASKSASKAKAKKSTKAKSKKKK